MPATSPLSLTGAVTPSVRASVKEISTWDAGLSGPRIITLGISFLGPDTVTLSSNKNNKFDYSIDIYEYFKENYEFVGWYKKSDFSGDKLITLTKEDYEDEHEITLYAKFEFKSATEINKLGYDLNNATISISIYSNKDNPYSEEYIYEDKELRKLQIEYIESKYNCNIEYVITDRLEQSELQFGQINNRYETVQKFNENNILIHYGELSDTFYESFSTQWQDYVFYPLNKIDGYEETNYRTAALAPLYLDGPTAKQRIASSGSYRLWETLHEGHWCTKD